MEATETSVIARKLKNFYSTQHTRPQVKAPLRPKTKTQSEPGFFKHLLMVSLMGLAVSLTEISLQLIKFVRRLEN